MEFHQMRPLKSQARRRSVGERLVSFGYSTNILRVNARGFHPRWGLPRPYLKRHRYRFRGRPRENGRSGQRLNCIRFDGFPSRAHSEGSAQPVLRSFGACLLLSEFRRHGACTLLGQRATCRGWNFETATSRADHPTGSAEKYLSPAVTWSVHCHWQAGRGDASLARLQPFLTLF